MDSRNFSVPRAPVSIPFSSVEVLLEGQWYAFNSIGIDTNLTSALQLLVFSRDIFGDARIGGGDVVDVVGSNEYARYIGCL